MLDLLLESLNRQQLLLAISIIVQSLVIAAVSAGLVEVFAKSWLREKYHVTEEKPRPAAYKISVNVAAGIAALVISIGWSLYTGTFATAQGKLFALFIAAISTIMSAGGYELVTNIVKFLTGMELSKILNIFNRRE